MKFSPQIIILQICLIFSVSASECEHFGTCSQTCEVSGGLPHCSCVDGFELTGNKSCSPVDPNWKIVYVSKAGVQIISNPGSIQETIVTNNDLSANLVSVTSDVRNNVYWASHAEETETIYRTSLASNRTTPEVVIDAGMYNPAEIAFEWITGNLYFLDCNLMYIAVCALDPTRCSVIIQESNTNRLSGLAIHPKQGIMFWTHWGDNPQIKKANMDGSSPTTIISTNVGWPNGVTVDKANSRIYWVEAQLEKIESSRFDGSDRIVVTASLQPVSFDIFGDYIFWSDWAGTHIMTGDKFTGRNETTVLSIAGGHRVNGLTIMHVGKQPKNRQNPCEIVSCPHVCALSGELQADCLCPAGMVHNDRDICTDDEKQPKLLVAQGSTLLSMAINAVGKGLLQQQIQLASQIKVIGALVYNPISKSLIIYDSTLNKIVEYNPNTAELRILVDSCLRNVTSIDIDVIGENLIWTDAGKHTVEVLSLRTMSRMITRENVTKPFDIVFSPDIGVLYLSDSEHFEKIAKIFLGKQSDDTFLVMDNVTPTWPIQILNNQETGRAIFAYHKGTESFVYAQRETVLGTMEPFGMPSSLVANGSWDMVKISNKIFMADDMNDIKVVTTISQSTSFLNVVETNFTTTGSRKVLASMNNDIGYLDQRQKDHDCSPKNPNKKRCAQICLPVGFGNEGTCWCSEGFHLGSDGVACIEDGKKSTTEVVIAKLDVTLQGRRLEDQTTSTSKVVYTTTPVVTVFDRDDKLTTEISSGPTKIPSSSSSLSKADENAGSGGSSNGSIIGYVLLAAVIITVVGGALFVVVSRSKSRGHTLLPSAYYSNVD